MSSVTSSLSGSKPLPASLYLWMLQTAVVGTIGTTWGFMVSSLLAVLFLFDQPTSRAHIYRYSEDAAARVFHNMLLEHVLVGSSLGLAIGISIAYAWKRFIIAAGKDIEAWMFLTVTSTWVGVTFTFIIVGISNWYGAGLPLIIVIVGIFSGILIGLPQSYILWSNGRARLFWVSGHSLIVIIAAILIITGLRTRDLIVIVVFIGLIWAAYGGVMGMTFNEMRYGNDEMQN